MLKRHNQVRKVGKSGPETARTTGLRPYPSNIGAALAGHILWDFPSCTRRCPAGRFQFPAPPRNQRSRRDVRPPCSIAPAVRTLTFSQKPPRSKAGRNAQPDIQGPTGRDTCLARHSCRSVAAIDKAALRCRYTPALSQTVPVSHPCAHHCVAPARR